MSSDSLIAHVLTRLQCGTCGIVHAIARVKHQTPQREGGGWHGRTGHAHSYRKRTEAGEFSRVRAELEAERECMTLARASDAERDRTSTNLRRQRHRAAHGVCPCCKRTFQFPTAVESRARGAEKRERRFP